MNRNKDAPVELCERKFILDTIQESKRTDGRGVYDYRDVNISLGGSPGCVEVTLGRTRVLARVTCQVVRPRPQRPTEGVLFYNVELSPMASPSFESGRQSSMSVEVHRILERCQKESRAIDTESLCIIAGQKVWEVRIDLHVLDHCGNIIDCASIAAITALKHFRRPDVTVIGEEATIHPLSERDPVPLSVHHMPLCFTFAFFLAGEYMLVDPSLEEEQVMEGKLVVGMNIHREICVLQIMGGVAILPQQVMRCTQIAAVKCVEITEMIKDVISGKNNPMEFESILHSERQEEEVDEDVCDSHLASGEEGEEPMEEGSRTEQVNYLGPGTAELVGMGGSNTWEVLDSLTDCSDEDIAEGEGTSLQPKTTPTNSRKEAPTKPKQAPRRVGKEVPIKSKTALSHSGKEAPVKPTSGKTAIKESPIKSKQALNTTSMNAGKTAATKEAPSKPKQALNTAMKTAATKEAPVKPKKAASDGQSHDPDSEEEETVQLTNIDFVTVDSGDAGPGGVGTRTKTSDSGSDSSRKPRRKGRWRGRGGYSGTTPTSAPAAAVGSGGGGGGGEVTPVVRTRRKNQSTNI